MMSAEELLWRPKKYEPGRRERDQRYDKKRDKVARNKRRRALYAVQNK